MPCRGWERLQGVWAMGVHPLKALPSPAFGPFSGPTAPGFILESRFFRGISKFGFKRCQNSPTYDGIFSIPFISQQATGPYMCLPVTLCSKGMLALGDDSSRFLWGCWREGARTAQGFLISEKDQDGHHNAACPRDGAHGWAYKGRHHVIT